MDKRKIKKLIVAAVSCIAVGIVTTAVLAAPGDSSDPIISKSYIDNVLMPQITQYIDSKLGGNSSADAGTSNPTFNVVEVKNGQTLIAESGTELILRMGGGTIIATAKGGIADTTAGCDLENGTQMPSNHLLIVPLGDGRGFVANDDVLVMVKGGYTLK